MKKICGYCTNWRCDEPLHLKGHCIINRMDRFHGTVCDTCTKYKSIQVKNELKEVKNNVM